MKILVIGGTGFIGPFVIRSLVREGHQVTVFHRGNAKPDLPDSVHRIVGDRNDLGRHRAEFERLSPEVVVDFILGDDRQAKTLMDTVRGFATRVIAISSQDVYRAYEVLLRKTPGPLQELPITEESELRTILHPYSAEQLRAANQAFSWFTEDYDKIPVEEPFSAIQNCPAPCFGSRWSMVLAILCTASSRRLREWTTVAGRF